MRPELKIGLVGLDTSHVTAFAQLLNVPDAEHAVAGGRIVAGFPGGSCDFPLSIERVAGFTAEMAETYGVEILDSPQEVAQCCDAIMLTAVDGRVHREMFAQIAPYGKPTFIDKPFAISSEDARAIAQLAREHSVPVMSCSSLRYAQPVEEALQEIHPGAILGADVSGPLPVEATQNDLFWYGIHATEMLYAALGTGCLKVQAMGSGSDECITGVWKDGRIGTIRGDHEGQIAFGLTLHTPSLSHLVAPMAHTRPLYAGLLKRIIPFLESGVSPICIEETLEMVRFLEAANQSRATGRAVAL